MRLVFFIFLFMIILILTSVVLFNIELNFEKKDSIKVGLIFSTKGAKKSLEVGAEQATLFAIEEINKQGGLLGKQIFPVLFESEMDWKTIKPAIEHFVEEGVSAIFGCGSPWDYQEVDHLVRKKGHTTLLFTPFRNIDMTESKNMISLGISINQQVQPSVDYFLEHIGKHFFLIGSQDDNISHLINFVIKDTALKRDGKLAGENYISATEDSLDQAIQTLIKSQAQVIFNTLSGDAQQLFFKKLREANISSEMIPVFSFNLSEQTLQNTENIDDMVGSYVTWNYFQSIDNPTNNQFLDKFLDWADIQYVDNSTEAAYVSVQIWAKAVREMETLNPSEVLNAFSYLQLLAPEGPVTMTSEGHAAWKFVRIAKVVKDKKFEIIWESPVPISPYPNPLFISQHEWEDLLNSLSHHGGTDAND